MRLSELRNEWPNLERHEFERLVALAAGVTRADLADVDLDSETAARFAELAHRRLGGEPLQYIEGTVAFGPIELVSDQRALIPRPETEQLWEKVVARVESPRVVVDLCTGSGNLALACKHEWPDARVVASDASSDAIALARENAERTDLAVELFVGDLFDPLPHTLRGVVDVILANPPYLAAVEAEGLPAEVREHEPGMALVAGPQGDEILSVIASRAPRWLRPGGLIACEISEFRSDDVAKLFVDLGGTVDADLAGKPRFVFGRNEMPDAHCVAHEALRHGEVIGIPTDTVYGLAANAFSQEGVDRLYELKVRDRSKPLPVLAANLAQVHEVAVLDDRTLEVTAGGWPGGVTYVVRRRPGVPDWVGDATAGTIGVRIPAHEELISLMRRTGPLAATSANFSGDDEVLDATEAHRLFGDGVSVYVPGRAVGTTASAVVDATGREPRTLRPGPA